MVGSMAINQFPSSTGIIPCCFGSLDQSGTICYYCTTGFLALLGSFPVDVVFLIRVEPSVTRYV